MRDDVERKHALIHVLHPHRQYRSIRAFSAGSSVQRSRNGRRRRKQRFGQRFFALAAHAQQGDDVGRRQLLQVHGLQEEQPAGGDGALSADVPRGVDGLRDDLLAGDVVPHQARGLGPAAAEGAQGGEVGEVGAGVAEGGVRDGGAKAGG